jgi:hypothetical protein
MYKNVQARAAGGCATQALVPSCMSVSSKVTGLLPCAACAEFSCRLLLWVRNASLGALLQSMRGTLGDKNTACACMHLYYRAGIKLVSAY